MDNEVKGNNDLAWVRTGNLYNQLKSKDLVFGQSTKRRQQKKKKKKKKRRSYFREEDQKVDHYGLMSLY